MTRIGRKEANAGTGRKTLEKKDNVEELGVDGKIKLKYNSRIPYLRPKMGREDVERTTLV